MNGYRWIRGAFVALLGGSRLLFAQTGTATLTGTIRDVTGTPIAAVRVTARASGITTQTDTSGRFALRGLADGTLALVVRRMGYEPGEFSVTLARQANLNLDVTLVQASVHIAGMETDAASRVRLALAEFYLHRDGNNGGHFFVRADLDKQNPHRLSDMLRTVPGVDLHTDPNGQFTVRMSRANLGAFRDCPVEYWIDGMHVPSFNIDDVAPQDVEAMEIYNGPSTLPPEYHVDPGTPSCGTIAIWTRVPNH